MIRRATDRLLELPLVYQTWQAPFVSAKLKPFLKYLDLKQTRRVLDVGCGPGTNARVFAGCDYVGIDINPEYIRTASSRYPGRWVVGDVTDETIFPNEHFDCLFANSLMHHLDDRAVRNLLSRMARLTAPRRKGPRARSRAAGARLRRPIAGSTRSRAICASDRVVARAVHRASARRALRALRVRAAGTSALADGVLRGSAHVNEPTRDHCDPHPQRGGGPSRAVAACIRRARPDAGRSARTFDRRRWQP